MKSIAQLPIRGQSLPVAAPITAADAILIFQNGVCVEATIADLPAPSSFMLTQGIVDAIFAWGDNVGPVSEISLISATGVSFVAPNNIIFNSGTTINFIAPAVNFSIGATGTFTTADGKTVTVTAGIVTSIV